MLVTVQVLVAASIDRMAPGQFVAGTVVDPPKRLRRRRRWRALPIHSLGKASRRSLAILSCVQRQLSDLGFELGYLVIEICRRQGFTELGLFCGLQQTASAPTCLLAWLPLHATVALR